MQNFKKAICVQSSKEYYIQTRHAIESAKKHNPEYKVVLLSDGIESNIVDFNITPEQLNINRDEINPSNNSNVWLVTGRPAIAKYTLEVLNFDSCIFIDGDTYTYNSYETIENFLNNGSSFIVTPHNLKPLPNDNKAPSIQDICLMGNYNSGVYACSKKGLNFLNWWDTQTRKYPYMYKQSGIAAEQGWLRFVADFDDDVKILRDPGYNVAYWNVAQRNLSIRDDIYYTDDKKLTLMHFSGMKKDTKPEVMSLYQNRYQLNKDGVIYKIYNEYKQLVWGSL